MLENAINGCKTLPDPAARVLYLTVDADTPGSLYITVVNSFDGKTKKLGNQFLSTNGDSGIGLSSITSLAEKYHGAVRFEANDREFTSSVMLLLE